MLKHVKIEKSIINDLIDVTEKYDIILNNISELNMNDMIDCRNISNNQLNEYTTLRILSILTREKILKKMYSSSLMDTDKKFENINDILSTYINIYDTTGYHLFKDIRVYFYKNNDFVI